MKRKKTYRPPTQTVIPPTDPTFFSRPGLVVMRVSHDPWCMASTTQNEADCHPTCSPIVRFIRPFDKDTPK